MVKKTTNLTAEERDLFRDSVKINQPIKQDKKSLKTPKPKKKPINIESQKKLDQYLGVGGSLLEKLSPNDWLTAEDYIHFARTGIPYRTLNKLKRGQLPVERRIDLHRLTGDEMLEKMSILLQYCSEHGQRLLLVVHGKGGTDIHKPPILKNILNQWLRHQPEVLAFTSAKPQDGGCGALYVLLKSGTQSQ